MLTQPVWINAFQIFGLKKANILHTLECASQALCGFVYMMAPTNRLPCHAFFLQYTNYDYSDGYDYGEEEVVTEAPPTDGGKTEVTLD